MRIALTAMVCLVIFLIGIVQYLSFTNDSIYDIILGCGLFGFQYIFIMILFLGLDKGEWINKMNPFKLTGSCDT